MKQYATTARRLAAEYDLGDVIQLDSPDPYDQISSSNHVLSPALDLVDGTVYIGTPLTKTVTRQVAVKRQKGKFQTLTSEEPNTLILTSDHDSFWYGPDECKARGLIYDPQYLQQDAQARWSTTSSRAFRDGSTPLPDASALLGDIQSVYNDYVWFSNNDHYLILPLFVMATYVHIAFDAMAYINFQGNKGSGKSRNIKVLEALALNTTFSANLTPAALFRQVSGWRGLVALDEAERMGDEEHEELKKILNSGYQQGGSVLRAEPQPTQGRFLLRKYNAYGPKVIAGIDKQPAVLLDRCIEIFMAPAQRPIPEFNLRAPEWQEIRDRLYLWTMNALPATAAGVEAWNQTTRWRRCPDLINRPWQIAQSYIVLADLIGGDDLTDRVIAFFRTYFEKQLDQQDQQDRQRLLLRCLPGLIKSTPPDPAGRYSGTAIHQRLGEYLEDDVKESRGYTTRTTYAMLENLGFKDFKRGKSATFYALPSDQIREAMQVRRVVPFEDDIAWYESDQDPAAVYRAAEQRAQEEQARKAEEERLSTLWSETTSQEGLRVNE